MAHSEKSVLIAVIGAIAAVIAAVAAPLCSNLFSTDNPQPVAAASTADAPSPITPTSTLTPIEGAWKQFGYDQNGAPVEIGTYVVTRQRGEYVISARAQLEAPFMENSLGIFDVQYDGALWTFNSNWGQGQVGNFELERVSPTVFEGEIRVAGRVPNRTRWVKIE